MREQVELSNTSACNNNSFLQKLRNVPGRSRKRSQQTAVYDRSAQRERRPTLHANNGVREINMNVKSCYAGIARKRIEINGITVISKRVARISEIPAFLLSLSFFPPSSTLSCGKKTEISIRNFRTRCNAATKILHVSRRRKRREQTRTPRRDRR